MSTFKGVVKEFPRIRIDYFRTIPGSPPPLACFLSHVHSDHLLGLDSLKSPFVYCSPATREILLRLEKYGHRMNFARGILECRKQTYKHLKNLLRTIPLETPAIIELSAGNDIQVTLFNANHCTGSVMFLIEGQGKAILYTGDTRSETWLVNSIARHPIMVPYASDIQRLDRIYLDTTFAMKDDLYLEFPSKADGLAELLKKIAKYPEDTRFYFNAWTFGYEDIWLALSRALNSPIHLDRYRYGIYSSLARTSTSGISCHEAPTICGFTLGNSNSSGFITRDSAVKLHSCERGTECSIFEDAQNVVTITPIVSRHNGVTIPELGAGGGNGDLNKKHELDLRDSGAVKELVELCKRYVNDEATAQKITALLSQAARQNHPSLQMSSDILATFTSDRLSVPEAVQLIKRLAMQSNDKHSASPPPLEVLLPRAIQFPYSRHSSCSELRTLVAAFLPRDIYPCTVPPIHVWNEELSMERLFRDLYCSSRPHNAGEDGNSNMPGCEFAHDNEMRTLREALRKRKREEDTTERKSQRRENFEDTPEEADVAPEVLLVSETESAAGSETESDLAQESDDAERLHASATGREAAKSVQLPYNARKNVSRLKSTCSTENAERRMQQQKGAQQISHMEDERVQQDRRRARIEAFEAARAGRWGEDGNELLCISDFKSQLGGNWSSREGSEEL